MITESWFEQEARRNLLVDYRRYLLGVPEREKQRLLMASGTEHQAAECWNDKGRPPWVFPPTGAHKQPGSYKPNPHPVDHQALVYNKAVKRLRDQGMAEELIPAAIGKHPFYLKSGYVGYTEIPIISLETNSRLLKERDINTHIIRTGNHPYKPS